MTRINRLQAEEALMANATAVYPYQDPKAQKAAIQRLQAIAEDDPEDGTQPTPISRTGNQYTDVRDFFAAFQRDLSARVG